MKGGAQGMKHFKIVKTRTETQSFYVEAKDAETALKALMERESSYNSYDRPPLIQIHEHKSNVECDEITPDEALGAQSRFVRLNSPCEMAPMRERLQAQIDEYKTEQKA